MPDRFQICAETVGDEDKLYYCTDDISMTPDSHGRVFIQLNTSIPTSTPGSSSLKPHRRYKAIITGKNQAGERNSTGDIHFSKPNFMKNMHIDDSFLDYTFNVHLLHL